MKGFTKRRASSNGSIVSYSLKNLCLLSLSMCNFGNFSNTTRKISIEMYFIDTENLKISELYK